MNTLMFLYLHPVSIHDHVSLATEEHLHMRMEGIVPVPMGNTGSPDTGPFTNGDNGRTEHASCPQPCDVNLPGCRKAAPQIEANDDHHGYAYGLTRIHIAW